MSLPQKTATILRPMLGSDLEQVFAWRNHPDVRRFMYNSRELELDEHQRWFAAAQQDARRHLFIFEMDGEARGFMNLYRIFEAGVCDWGFYVAPGSPRGTGRALGEATLAHAFGNLGMHKMYGQVLGFNAASRGLHLRLGFSEEGILRDHYHDGERFHAVHCFGLLVHEWRSRHRGVHA